MYSRLSLLMITKNSGELLEKSLQSVDGLINEIIIVDNDSTDQTLEIVKKYKAHIFNRQDEDLGAQRAYGFSKCNGEWILMLDADEVISPNLKTEIKFKVQSLNFKVCSYYIPYQNHFLGKPIYYGGEDYKILRLFKKSDAFISKNVIHEHVKVTGETNVLRSKIYHYSYRTLSQTFKKFTDYAHREAQKKCENGEQTNLWKLFTYPIHMFWARYIKDKGYKDYYLRFLLDFGFAYMEFLTYFLMFFQPNKSKKL